MNIFFLDDDIKKSVQYHVDRHVVKIITEANSMMATAYTNGVAPYKHTHINHPMSVWVRSNFDNFLWTLNYCYALCEEYTFRYNKVHKGQSVADWYKNNLPQLKDAPLTDPPRCFGNFDIPITNSVVTDYRNYYNQAKKHLFKWKNRKTPDWIEL